METIALVMAGGRGERMRSSGRPVPKPLVPIRGVTLLERSLYPLFRAGVSEIVISVPVAVPAIGEFATSRCAALGRASGSRVSLLEETEPLGNIGCAGLLAGRALTVLVVYADNLTSMDLSAILAHHHATGASLTLASHIEMHRSPYGELTVVEGRVTAYQEKPEHPALVCSAVSVLGPEALAALSEPRPMGLVDLFHDLNRQGHVIVEFRHEAPWIDVNDAAKVAGAEALVISHAPAFECWSDPPVRMVNVALVEDDGRLLLRRIGDPGRDSLLWALPLIASQPGLELTAVAGDTLAEFDDLDQDSGLVARHRVIACRARVDGDRLPDGLSWVSRGQIDWEAVTSPLARALAMTTGHAAIL